MEKQAHGNDPLHGMALAKPALEPHPLHARADGIGRAHPRLRDLPAVVPNSRQVKKYCLIGKKILTEHMIG